MRQKSLKMRALFGYPVAKAGQSEAVFPVRQDRIDHDHADDLPWIARGEQAHAQPAR